MWNGGNNNEEIKLAECYANSLKLAVENNCKTVAFPNISTGIYRFPKSLAAKISVKTVSEFLLTNDKMEKVLFICFDEENFNLLQEEIKKLS